MRPEAAKLHKKKLEREMDSAIALLDERLASGDITRDDYFEQRTVIEIRYIARMSRIKIDRYNEARAKINL